MIRLGESSGSTAWRTLFPQLETMIDKIFEEDRAKSREKIENDEFLKNVKRSWEFFHKELDNVQVSY